MYHIIITNAPFVEAHKARYTRMHPSAHNNYLIIVQFQVTLHTACIIILLPQSIMCTCSQLLLLQSPAFTKINVYSS